MAGKLEEFKSTVDTYGLAQLNYFEVEIENKIGDPSIYGDGSINFRKMLLLAESVSLPMASLRSKEIYNGPVHHRSMPYIKGLEDVQIGFLVDAKYSVRKYFENWVGLILGSRLDSKADIAYYNQYVTDISIWALDRQGKRVFGVKLINAYPRSISGLNYSHDSRIIAKQMVNFSYENYTIMDAVDVIGDTPNT